MINEIDILKSSLNEYVNLYNNTNITEVNRGDYKRSLDIKIRDILLKIRLKEVHSSN